MGHQDGSCGAAGLGLAGDNRQWGRLRQEPMDGCPYVRPPLEGEPYTPTQWFAKGKHDTDIRTKPPMASA